MPPSPPPKPVVVIEHTTNISYYNLVDLDDAKAMFEHLAESRGPLGEVMLRQWKDGEWLTLDYDGMGPPRQSQAGPSSDSTSV